MATLILSRADYDLLVTNCPAWMELRWAEYRKQWFIGGVTVCASKDKILNLSCQLAYAKAELSEKKLGEKHDISLANYARPESQLGE